MVAFGALIVLLVVIVAVALAVSRGINESATEKYVDDAIPLKSAVQDLVLQTVSRQSSVRGYLVTQREDFLDTYADASRAAEGRLRYIRANVDGHPILADLIVRAEREIDALTVFYEAELGRRGSGPRTLAQTRRLVEEGSGRFASFRETARLMIADTDAFVRDAKTAQDRRTDALTVVLVLLGAMAVAVAAALLVVAPRRITAVMGDLEAERAATARAADRAVALQRLTAAFAPTLDEDAVLDALSREVRDAAGVDEVIVSRPDPAGDAIELRTLGGTRGADRRRRLPIRAELPIPTVARTAEPMFFPAAADAIAAFPDIAEMVETTPEGSWAVLPMRAGGSPQAVLALRFVERRAFTPGERTFLLTLADQCAQALERVRLHQEQVHIAHELQQSLLPAELPRVAGLELAARYVTAEAAQEVGGDFYDVFEDETGRLAIVVGDACGKGPEAAALTALARYTVRAVAGDGASPAATLGRLNGAIRRQGLGTLFLTAAHAMLEREDAGVRVTVSRAGHPHPLVVRAGGDVEELGGAGRLLGIFDDPALTDVEVVLGPGDCLAVFTDGLTEARQGRAIMGEERLRIAAARCRGLPAEECADLLLRAASEFAGGALRDDVALVVARVAGGPGSAGAS
ncbi:MAG: SpoIIE family protein phosphatase [Thermoleophilia bacterium]|nr:SpoIIE family protein phosphatase [Thermoleophilia bacterium]